MYYVSHFIVHKIKYFKWIHTFHHKFVTNIPSIGNSVSVYEFVFMYITPFIAGTVLLAPTKHIKLLRVNNILLIY